MIKGVILKFLASVVMSRRAVKRKGCGVARALVRVRLLPLSAERLEPSARDLALSVRVVINSRPRGPERHTLSHSLTTRQQKQPMGLPIKILAMDGGNGMNTATLLQQLENINGKNYLNEVLIFAGTSAGGINSLFFAREDNPTAALNEVQFFWSDVNSAVLDGLNAKQVFQKALAGLQTSPLTPFTTADWQGLAEGIIGNLLGLGMASSGFRSLFLNDTLKKFLIKRFGNDTLRDLKKKVVIVAFQLDSLDNEEPGIKRSWAPRLYTNLPYRPCRTNDLASPLRDMNETIVDVALRTSGAPLELPIYQSTAGDGPGFVDGGLAANNPAMIALAAIVGTLAEGVGSATPPIPPTPPTHSLNDIYLLSVGTGRNLVGTAQYLQPKFTDGSAVWGYRQWLLDPANPLVLIDALLGGANEAVAWQCEHLLRIGGVNHFHRLNVPLEKMLVPCNGAVKQLVQEAADWLDKSGWTTTGGLTLLPGPA